METKTNPENKDIDSTDSVTEEGAVVEQKSTEEITKDKEDRTGDIAIILVVLFIAAILIGHFTMKSSVESGVVKNPGKNDSIFVAPLPGVEDAHKTLKERGLK